MSYDSAGHATGTGSATFNYMNNGRMSSAVTAAGTFNYVYNPLGQLVKRSGPGITLTYFVYDEAGHLVGEYGNTGQLIQETVWLGDIPVATLRSNGSGGVDIYYVHTDHLNTPRKVTRPSDDKLRWRWDPDAFGNGSPSQNPQSLGNFVYNMRLPGQIYSPETGMNQNYFRDYDPAIGRYVESDPRSLREHAESLILTKRISAPLRRDDSLTNAIQLPFELNPYLYTFNNPVHWVDPTGESGLLGGAIIVSGTCFLMYCTLKAKNDCDDIYPGHGSDPESHRKFMQCVSKTTGVCLKLGQMFMDPIGESTEAVIEQNCSKCQN
jgi:RHS repeat-associated protein